MWGSASPAQLIHDFEGFPHVPGVKGDWTLSLRSVFLLQRMWTKSSAPEGDISQREKAGNNPYHQYMQDDKQHAPERTIFHLYTSAVETTSLYKRRNKQHQPELQLNSVSHLYPFTFQAISHTHTRTFAYTAETLAHYLSQEEHVDCFLCLTLGAPHVLSLSLTLNFLFFFFFFLSNCSRTTSRMKPLAKVWHVNAESFVLLPSHSNTHLNK